MHHKILDLVRAGLVLQRFSARSARAMGPAATRPSWNRARTQASRGTEYSVVGVSGSESAKTMVVPGGDTQSDGASLGDAKTQGAEGRLPSVGSGGISGGAFRRPSEWRSCDGSDRRRSSDACNTAESPGHPVCPAAGGRGKRPEGAELAGESAWEFFLNRSLSRSRNSIARET